MMANLPQDLSRFVFVDIGSGKGRALLMASDYPFKRILGVEVLPELHRIAEQNIRGYKSDSQRRTSVTSICTDARSFEFPDDPLVLYLFNPLPESGLVTMLANLSQSVASKPREVWILYHNPLLEPLLAATPGFVKVNGTGQYVLYRNVPCP